MARKGNRSNKRSSPGGDRHDNRKNDKDGNDEDDREDDDDNNDDGRRGTANVARGMTSEQAEERYDELESSRQSSRDKALVTKYADDELARERLEILKRDDEDPENRADSKLNDYQKRALEKRVRRKDKAVESNLKVHKTKRLEAAVAAADAHIVLHTENPGMVEPENDMERTTQLRQIDLKRKYLDEQTKRHIFNLTLTDYSPYKFHYDRSGRSALVVGRRGHVAMLDCHELRLNMEFHAKERVRDACFLHNSTLFALAQTKHAFIYDDTGAEVHKLNDHVDPFALDFLPYHWLLASIGRQGILRYQDTSTGELVSKHLTRLGACSVMRQNPSNAIMHCGHRNGVVTLWSPASSEYLVKMLCHKGFPITSMAIDKVGHTMVTGGADSKIKIWDLRNTYKEMHSYNVRAGPPTSLDISQQGMLGVGHAGHATIWGPDALREKVRGPYMHHVMPGCGPVDTLRFRPFEDVCGIGHAKGVSSIVIPGSGEPNLDTSEYGLNPFEDTKQRRESEVRALLDKLAPTMITLNPNAIGGMEESDTRNRQQRLRDMQEDANAKAANQPDKKQKSKKRGRSKIQTQMRRKQRNVVDEQMTKLREARDEEMKAKKKKQQVGSENDGDQTGSKKPDAPAALQRFF